MSEKIKQKTLSIMYFIQITLKGNSTKWPTGQWETLTESGFQLGAKAWKDGPILLQVHSTPSYRIKKINSRWAADPNMKSKTKFTGKKEHLHYLQMSKDYFKQDRKTTNH